MRRNDYGATGATRPSGQMASGSDCCTAPETGRHHAAFFADDGETCRQTLIDAILALPEKEQYVMSMFYEHDMQLKEIAAVLKVTESRVCQIKAQAIARLRLILVSFALKEGM